MSVSERISQAQEAARLRGDITSTWRDAPNQSQTVDGLGDFKSKVHDALFERLGTRLFEATSEAEMHSLVMTEISALMDTRESALSPEEREFLVQDIARDVMGLGPLEQFLNDPTVSEVMVNGSENIYVERAGVIERTNVHFISEEHLRRVIERIVSSVGRRVDESSPMVDARLADGSRVNVIVPPLSLDGSILTIRKFAKDPFTVSDLIAMGTMTDSVASLLSASVAGWDEPPRLGRHRHGQDHACSTCCRASCPTRSASSRSRMPSNCSCSRNTWSASRPVRPTRRARVRCTIRDLVRNACACGPTASSSARCRGAEALDMLQAMNTGHDGSLTTVHANAPRDALARLETMVLMAATTCRLVRSASRSPRR